VQQEIQIRYDEDTASLTRSLLLGSELTNQFPDARHPHGRSMMKSVMKIAGVAGGYLGSVICLFSIGGRFFGKPVVLGWEASHILLLGIALVVMACWAKLEAA
jgi:divalent metal cation (Fe/Co/Zn/Cd) transporter